MKAFLQLLLFVSLLYVNTVFGFHFFKPVSRNTLLRTLTSSDVKLETMKTNSPPTRLQWNKDGYKFWNWKGLKVHYVDLGKCDSNSKPPLLLVHGFGASVYHWRYNIPALSEKYHVYALDLLGFGLSDKVFRRIHSYFY